MRLYKNIYIGPDIIDSMTAAKPTRIAAAEMRIDSLIGDVARLTARQRDMVARLDALESRR